MNSLNRAAMAARLQELSTKISFTIRVRDPARLEPMPLVALLEEATDELTLAAEYIISIKTK